MKLRQIFAAAAVCALPACTFFEEPLSDIGSLPPPPNDSVPVPAAPPPLPSPSQNKETATAQTSAEGSYFIVSSIFEVPENVANLSFVHFTERSKRRESAVCEALLNTYPITRPADVPATASNLIIWPITEGTSADNCRDMVEAHEPLDISSQTAATVNSDGPYLLSRNSPQQKQMIYDLSAVSTGSLSGALDEWRQVLVSGEQNWLPVVKAQ